MYLVILVEGKKAEAGYKRATELLHHLKTALLKPGLGIPAAKRTNFKSRVCANFSQNEFMAAVRRAKEYIAAGDILQVVLSQRLEMLHNSQPFDIYRALRSVNPSPYLYYLNQGEYQLIGSSPEMLVRVEQGIVETRPIAGTRPRGSTLAEDRAKAAELLAHPKERAEHIMLVDLGRNDLGKVCRLGTVKVTELMGVEKFSHVMHLVSTVQGELSPELSPLDALLACFPAGTVSGAPKVRAMQIISELEPQARGIYAGAVCYLGLNNTLDSCIAIRTIINKGNTAYMQAGAGIVADSDPESEYLETCHKAQALLKAIAKAEEELAC
ncbi:anthranilate synthase component I family protein [Zhaonella formicivorans]|uniref:anthranilate synthase component I family protein n=1 Tax=Zhaonella formicivorans TaxID=2528593 RepID=UPI001D11708B|nr:anthranilate synthase component I family protein [Zhaonella formicivorans]